MNIDFAQASLIVGMVANFAALIKLAMAVERRFTMLEVHVQYLRHGIERLPKRDED